MPIKCESCRFFSGEAYCYKAVPEEPISVEMAIPIDRARNICDREGDGIFVYFEPKEPTAGAAFAGTAGVSPARPADDLVQITRIHQRPCSCLGTCRGAERLGANYKCSLGRRDLSLVATAGGSL